jgi:hypothetical protein
MFADIMEMDVEFVAARITIRPGRSEPNWDAVFKVGKPVGAPNYEAYKKALTELRPLYNVDWQ